MDEESEHGVPGHSAGDEVADDKTDSSKTAVSPAILEVARLLGALVALEEMEMEIGKGEAENEDCNLRPLFDGQSEGYLD